MNNDLKIMELLKFKKDYLDNLARLKKLYI